MSLYLACLLFLHWRYILFWQLLKYALTPANGQLRIEVTKNPPFKEQDFCRSLMEKLLFVTNFETSSKVLVCHKFFGYDRNITQFISGVWRTFANSYCPIVSSYRNQPITKTLPLKCRTTALGNLFFPTPEAVLQTFSYKTVFWKHAAILKESTHDEVWFPVRHGCSTAN